MSDKEVSEKGIVHPLTTLLIRKVDEATAHLEGFRFLEALRCMDSILSIMDKADVPQELHVKIRQQPNRVASFDERQKREFIRGAAHAYRGWLDEVIQTLYSGGYFSGTKFGLFHDPSKGKRSQ